MNSEKPMVQESDSHLEDTRETHPAYAMIGASRVTGSATLAGSDFNHQHYIHIEIRHGHISRSLSNDRWHGDKSIVRVSLSEAQWATFVSSMNVGFGVPCTLEWTQQDGRIPSIEKTLDRAAQFKGEVSKTMKDALTKMQEAYDAAPTKKLKDMIGRAMTEIRANVSFVEDQFAEHMEHTVEKAKIEVNAYVTNAIQRAGLQAMAAGDVKLLEIAPTPEK